MFIGAFSRHQTADLPTPTQRLRILVLAALLRHNSAPDGGEPVCAYAARGHSDIKTTMRYVHASGFDDLAAAVAKMA